MGFDKHLCTSWLVCSFLVGALQITATQQHAHLAATSNLVQSKTSSSSLSSTAGDSSKSHLGKRKYDLPESLGVVRIKESHLPLLASPLQPKRARARHIRRRNLRDKKNAFNLRNDGFSWFEGWPDSPLSRHPREAPKLEESNITSNHLSSVVSVSEKDSAYHTDNAIPSIHSLSFKPTETKLFSTDSKKLSDHSSVNPSLVSSNLVTDSMTSSLYLPDLEPSAKTKTQSSSVKIIDTSTPLSSFQPTETASKILPTKIIPTPSVIPSSSIISPSPELPKVDEHLTSSVIPPVYFRSFAALEPSMPSLGGAGHRSVKTIVESTVQSPMSSAISTAHVPTPTLPKPHLTNLSTSPVQSSSLPPPPSSSSVLSNEIPNVLDSSSSSVQTRTTNKILSSFEDQFHPVSVSSLNIITTVNNSSLSVSPTQNKNLTLGDQPTPRISAQTESSSLGTVPKSSTLPHSSAAHTSKYLTETSFPHSSSSEITPSSTLQTMMATKIKITVTSTWYQPASARMVSPLPPLFGSKTTSITKTTTKPKISTQGSVTSKPSLDGANYSIPRTEPEPETELKPTSHPIFNSSGPDSEYAGDLLAEPVPNWELAKGEWKAAWEVHLYLFGILFAILAIYSLVSIIRLWHIKHLLSKQYFIVLNLLIFVFCLLRTLFLLIDGYNSNRTFLPVIEYFLVSTGFPCLTSSFSILFYALLTATKVQMLPVQVQRLPVLICIVLFHFLLSLSADILIAFFVSARILLFVCQLFFILWGLFLFLGYIYAFKSLYSAAKKRQKSLLQLRQANNQWESNYSPSKERLTLSLGIKVTLLSAILGTVCACLQAYAALGVFSVFSRETPEPWPWWGYQTGIRFIEFLFCLTMTYVATQPFKYQSKYDCDSWFYLSSCIQLCQIKSVWNTTNDPGWNELDEAITNTLITKNGGRKEIKAAGYEIIPLTITLSTDADLSMQDPLENESMLVVQDGFVRFRTNEELEELRRSPRIPRMDLTESKPIPTPPTKPKTLQWGENSTRGHQNGGFQSGDTLPGHLSPDCISSSTSPSSSQWNRISTTGSDLTFRLPSLSLADSIDKELEQYFRRSSTCSEKSLYSVRSTSMPGGIEMGSSDISESNVFPSEGSPIGNGPTDGDCLPDLDPTFSIKQGVRKGNVRDKLVNNVRYLSLDDLGKYPQNSSCGIQLKAESDT